VKAMASMLQCRNLDEFHDIVFSVDGSYIKANSIVLSARSEYFSSMLSKKYQFRESKKLSLNQGQGVIKVEGVPKLYFSNII
jgi:hypothetical protein